jgi:hypothetical protein
MAAEAEVPISIGWFEANYAHLAFEDTASPVSRVVRDFGNRHRT